MKHSLAAIALLLICATLLWPKQAVAQTASQQSPVEQSHASSVNGALPAIQNYPDSPQGLEQLMKDMLRLEKKGDAKSLAPYVQSLILPNPSAWFTATFGEKLGAELADGYDRARMNLPLAFPDTLSQIQSKHLDKVQAIRFTDSCDAEATDSEYLLLVSRTHEQPLYDVRFSSRTETATVSYFAYVDGTFRDIGYFRVSNPTISILKVGGPIMAKKGTYTPAPKYPLQAKIDHRSGTVVFHALIGPNGQVCSLQAIQGPPDLVEASFDAVRQWTYSPTTINGKPVVIDTTITVVFTLGE